MKNFITILFVFGTVNLAISQSFSSFIDYVNSLPENERTEAVDSFMTIITPLGIPYINEDTANFLYRGNANSISVPGDFSGWDPSFFSMTKVDGTNFWYVSQIFEMDARLDYKFVINGSNWILDPLNPNQVSGGFGPNSELAMHEYVQPWEIEYNQNIPHGTIETDQISSTNTGSSFQLQIYLPYNYNPNRTNPYPVAYFQDGHEYVDLGSADNVLDNLIYEDDIDTIIGVFVKPNNRNEEYAGNLRNEYRLFFAEELVPYIDENYNTIEDPAGRAVIGDSFGGNISALISYNHPDVFGLCGLHSGAFWPNDYEAYNLITQGTIESIKWASIWGTYEGLYENMRDFRDFLIENNYELKCLELPEGHSWGLWRATIDEMLTYFFPSNVSGITQQYNIEMINLSIYPNPVKDIATVSFDIEDVSDLVMELLDVNGKVIFIRKYSKRQIGEVELNINTSKLEPGLYFINVITKSGIGVSKLIKK